jgi:hypothetical protein
MERRQEILKFSGLAETYRIDAYLGLPTFVGKSRMQAFQQIKERVLNCLQNWKVNFLSQAGNEVLLKAMLQAIPTYSMGVFQIHISLCKEINALMQSFWWSHMNKTSKIHWMSWERLGVAKAAGGLGFRGLVIFNKALLAKQGWRILQNPESLSARLLIAKYFPNATFMEVPIGAWVSFVWRSICNARELLSQGLLRRVGDGHSIKIWEDRWLLTPITHSVQSPTNLFGQTAMVFDLIDQTQGCWKRELLTEVFLPEEAQVIYNVPLSPCLPQNRQIWKATKNEVFTVRSAYHLGKELSTLACGQSSESNQGKGVWKFRSKCSLGVRAIIFYRLAPIWLSDK